MDKALLLLKNQNFQQWRDLESFLEKRSNAEKGLIFEYFSYFYFLYFRELYQITEIYSDHLKDRALPREVREKLRLEGRDIGVDGVYLTREGACVAYQAKFRSSRASPSISELSTFWTEGEYANYRCIISNAKSLPTVARKKLNHLAVLVDKFENLPTSFFISFKGFLFDGVVHRPPKAEPREYQKKLLNEILTGLKENSRAKFVAACGVGKTLIALWSAERTNAKLVLFIAPSLALIRQTLASWAQNSSERFDYLCVCSDQSVDLSHQNYDDIEEDETDLPVTTEADRVAKFIVEEHKGRAVIFATYHSLEVIEVALAGKNIQIDLAFCDEAHRTAGIKDSASFGVILDDARIPCARRLFMTATERVVRSRVGEAAKSLNRVVFSMNDTAIYGPTIAKLTFGDAIRQNIISDYRIVLATVTSSEVTQLVKTNRYLSVDNLEENSGPIPAEELFKQLLLIRAFNELGITKTVTFHSSIRIAHRFARVFSELSTLQGLKIWVSHINSRQSTGERAELITAFEKEVRAVVTNVRCLSEGVDIPLIDSIFFSDPRRSVIDIIQAIGRALRQPYGHKGKTAYIIVPVLLESDNNLDNQLTDPRFDTFFEVIQALRDQDEQLKESIDELNLAAVRGDLARRTPLLSKIKLILPEGFDLSAFGERVLLRIVEVNSESASYVGIGSRLGRAERGSSYTRIFKTLGDYNPPSYNQSLVQPTLAKFGNENEVLARAELKVNNNNVSHSERLGVIKLAEGKLFRLTALGKLLRASPINFDLLFQNQMLLYFQELNDRLFFPYRTALKIMARVRRMNYVEFLYGVYSLNAEHDEEWAIEEIVARINWIRDSFPNVQLTSEANRESVRQVLNEKHPVGFQANDLWTDRTTTGNQYRFFLQHMRLFGDLFTFDWDEKLIEIRENCETSISSLLESSYFPPDKVRANYGDLIWIGELRKRV